MKTKCAAGWQAVVLAEEVERLSIACRILEHRLGYSEGRAAGMDEQAHFPLVEEVRG